MRFPGLKACLEMMRKHDPQAQEDGFHLLRDHAAEYVDDLVAEFYGEQEHGLRCWLLQLIADARSERAVPLFAEHLRSGDESLRTWAVFGLKQLNTKEARHVLWEARAYTFATEEETERFRRSLKSLEGRE